MKTSLICTTLVVLFLSADEARACGCRCGCRRPDPRRIVARPCAYEGLATYAPPPVPNPAPIQASYQAPTPTTYEVPAPAPPATPTMTPAPTPTPIVGVQPLYTYETNPQSGVAYYYTYDDSGKLVVRQWMDWLFRGGLRAGMPAPPLPIIGRLGN